MVLYVLRKADLFAHKEFLRKHSSHYLCAYIFGCVYLGIRLQMGSCGLPYSLLHPNNALYYALHLAIYHLLFSTSNLGTHSAKRPKRQTLKRRTKTHSKLTYVPRSLRCLFYRLFPLPPCSCHFALNFRRFLLSWEPFAPAMRPLQQRSECMCQ